ncbi:alginate O-acetyltransferase AlgX-related protein [Dyella sedimenti]|uniref:alginate O-acetyltransferase AlgX-related protein n=1 Tax=Dyella sedimenti TaxID=2919947 RepID=UPI001FA9BCB1|nr:alginate biosynthesis protein AlgX [Dyella sedimenti]
MRRIFKVLLAAGIACSVGVISHAATPAPASPAYDAKPCCSLCPHAADPQAYAGSKFLSDFRVLIDGRDGWLFRTGLDLTTHFDVEDDNLAQLHRLSDALRQRGTEIVMVYQPPRGLMDPDKLTPQQRRGYDLQAARGNYAQVLQHMRSEGGVIVPPLDQLVNEQKGYDYYFRRDHHWTAAGAQHTAQVVAETMSKLPGFGSIPKKQFSTHTSGVIGKPGTLQKVATQLCGGGYSLQYQPAYVTEPVGGGSLLGDASQPEVVLVGTSNSDSLGGYNFAGYLEQYMGVDVLNVAITGGSFEGSLLHYLASKEFQQHPPKFLIWETPYQDYPDSEQSAYKVYRQAVPLVTDGCRGKTALMSRTVELHQGSNELLFNGGGRILPLVGRDYQLEFQFSDPGVKDMHAEVWYFSGLKESLKMHFKQYVDNGGRFDAELRSDRPDYASATVMGVTMLMDQAPAKPLSVTAQVCARDKSTQLASQNR